MSKSGQRASRADVGGQRVPKSPQKKEPGAQAKRSAESGGSKSKKKEEPSRKG